MIVVRLVRRNGKPIGFTQTAWFRCVFLFGFIPLYAKQITEWK